MLTGGGDMNEILKKRIEEAANDRYTDNTFAYKGFIDGAEWRINSVWNKNNVTPGYDCHVLIEDVYGNIYDDRYDADYNEYESGITKKEIKCWAYVDDLLPESK